LITCNRNGRLVAGAQLAGAWRVKVLTEMCWPLLTCNLRCRPIPRRIPKRSISKRNVVLKYSRDKVPSCVLIPL